MKITQEQTNRLRQKINEYCEKNRIFGVLRITWRGEIALEATFGYADLETKRPFTKHSAFTFYSLSKPFCVLGLLKLYDRGLLALDAHPSRYIPEAEGLDARVTIRHMLRHESGLPDFEQDKIFAAGHRPGTPERIRAHLADLKEYSQNFAPGTAMMYANVNMVLCALIIENISGLSYADYMKKEVFEPLEMKNAVVDHAGLSHPERVTGYALDESGALYPIERSMDWMMGAGDMLGTVDDAFALRNAIKDGLLLKQKTWQEVLTPSHLSDFGMGCKVTYWHGKKCITHTGGHLGFRTLHQYLPNEDFDWILLSNSGFGAARVDLREIIYSAFFEKTSDEKSEAIEMDKGYI